MVPPSVHYIPYPCALRGQVVPGGLGAALDNALSSVGGRTLRLITTDTASFTARSGVKIIGVGTPESPLPFGTWFSHRWAMAHTDAFTDVGCPPEALSTMFLERYDAAPGTLARLVEHIERYPMPEGPVRHFADLYRPAMRAMIGPAAGNGDAYTVVNWQDPFLFFPDVLAEWGDVIKAAGIYSTGHIHTAWSRGTHLFPEGRAIMNSLASLDLLLVYTERVREAVLADFRALAAESDMAISSVQRSDLPIDSALLQRHADGVNTMNYERHMEAVGIAEDRRAVIREVARARGAGLSCFLNICRADPMKGITVWLDGIEQFLRMKSRHEDVAGRYRFFGFHELIDCGVPDPYHLKGRYARYVRGRYLALQKRYPGVVHFCGSVPKRFIPFIADDMYPCVVSVQDGFNLVFPEMTWVNHYRGRARKGIVSMGTGFVDELVRLGFQDGALLIPRLNSAAFAEALAETIDLTSTAPEQVRSDTARLVQEYIMQRQGSLLVSQY